MTDARHRVRALVTIAARCARPGDPLHTELREALIGRSGLSSAGVDLVLSKHLETVISEAELTALVSQVGQTERCHVVLSAHVCTAALRALAIALATSSKVFVKASRRDPFLAELLVREGRREGLDLESTTSITPRAGDEVHVYGGDEAIRAVRAGLGPGVRLWAHGPGFGVAVVEGLEHVTAAERLVDDVIPFDQRGCLSPRIVLVEHDPSGFAHVVGRALSVRAKTVPRGTLSKEEASAITMFRELGVGLGELHAGDTHTVLFDPAPEAALLPPVGRSLLVLDRSQANVFSPLRTFITAVGLYGGAPGIHALNGVAAATHVPLGTMQRPPLDGPVDARTVVVVT